MKVIIEKAMYDEPMKLDVNLAIDYSNGLLTIGVSKPNENGGITFLDMLQCKVKSNG